MTFNGHRSHCDLPSATEVAGYAGPVVRRPIPASLPLNLAADALGRPPKTFRARGVSPMIANPFFRVAGQRRAADFAGVTIEAGWSARMAATATLRPGGEPS